MQDLLDLIQRYRVQKGWDKTDTPYNLSKSIVAESAELLECFLVEHPNREAIKSELADVLMYALSLARDLNVDVRELIEEKWLDVTKRYPDAD